MLQKLRGRGQDSGFTLIELLIVIVILGVLSAIVVFAVGSTGKNAAAAACQTDTKTVETAVEAYKAEVTTYPADMASIIKAGYLRDAPSSTHYTVDVDNAKGGVIVTPLPSGTATTIAPGDTTDTATTACAAVK
jgi:prepilin-type N-terminal cleavage/methylation domain-containing protein